MESFSLISIEEPLPHTPAGDALLAAQTLFSELTSSGLSTQKPIAASELVIAEAQGSRRVLFVIGPGEEMKNTRISPVSMPEKIVINIQNPRFDTPHAMIAQVRDTGSTVFCYSDRQVDDTIFAAPRGHRLDSSHPYALGHIAPVALVEGSPSVITQLTYRRDVEPQSFVCFAGVLGVFGQSERVYHGFVVAERKTP